MTRYTGGEDNDSDVKLRRVDTRFYGGTRGVVLPERL